VFTLWWALFLISNWLSQGSLRFGADADEISELKTSNVLYLLSDAADIGAAAFAVVVVLRSTRRQEERARRFAPA